jgi:heme-degrading monooxygenase HmoA
MFARLTTMNVKPDRIEEAIAIYKKSVIPAAKSQKGFVAAYLLADRETGKGLSITFWKTEQDALENERNRYYQEQLVKFLDMFQSPPIREGYEVSVEG